MGLEKEMTAIHCLRQVYRVEILKPLTSIDVDYGSLVEYPPLTVDMDGTERNY
jgi:hypothetical protein